MQEKSQDWHTEGVQIVSGDKLDTNMPQVAGMHTSVYAFNCSGSLQDWQSILMGEVR